MGVLHPEFPRVLYDTLVRLGYDGDAPVYHCRLSMAHRIDQCELSVTIPFDPTEPWLGSIIGSEPDTNIELMAHMALTSLCEDRLTATSALPIALPLFGIRRTPYGSNILRLCPTSRVRTSTPR
jgi:hypothetical protein